MSGRRYPHRLFGLVLPALEKSVWAHKLLDWSGQKLDVFVYFNNDMEGHAIKDAPTLISLVGG